jgi:hypothetical protein
MKVRSVKNDPISSIERDRGVIVRVQVMLDAEGTPQPESQSSKACEGMPQLDPTAK